MNSRFRMIIVRFTVAVIGGVVAVNTWSVAAEVSILVDRTLAPPARHGLDQLELSLGRAGWTIDRVSSLDEVRGDLLVVAGLATRDGPAAIMLESEGISLPTGGEALVIQKQQWRENPALVLCGSDPRGLMYAALDAADRVRWAGQSDDPLRHLRNTREKPVILERSVSIYTMHRKYFESRLYDESYWKAYFDLMARSRLNAFVVIFGYENGGFLAPPYPYFFDVESFPDVRMVGITPVEQQRNVRAFRRMIDLAHERGIDVIPGIWDHIYRGGVQGGGIPGASEARKKRTHGLVWGVTGENLAAYNKTALRKFLETFADIDGIQFRMHGESGLRRAEIPVFWHEIFSMIQEMRPGIRVDIRAKGLPDAVIEDALAQGVNFRVATKFWMEQMGMPFHPTHVNPPNQRDRRHGYADLLRFPQRYRVHWRLWTGGTSRALLWGDPDYVRRFVECARVYDGNSFDVNEPLATKMLAQPHDAAPFELLNPRYRYYKWEFQRYWNFYQVFGRLGYDPATPREVWEREFERRFGDETGRHVMRGLHLASRVLPRIVASSYRYRYFPTTRGWAEKMRIGDLPVFAEAEGSDVQQFANFREEAARVLSGEDTAKRRPGETGLWFARTSRAILESVDAAEESARDRGGKELLSTIADLKILANLALYHSRRMPAAVSYRLFEETGDLFALDDAIRGEESAIRAWRQIVQAAGDIYTDNLAMGIPHGGLAGHWKDELTLLEQGLQKLGRKRAGVARPAKPGEFLVAHVPIRKAAPAERISFGATIFTAGDINTVECVLRTQAGAIRRIAMKPVGLGMYAAEMTASTAEGRLTYFIEARDANGARATYPPSAEADPIVLTVSDDDTPPIATLIPVGGTKPGRPLRVTAKVSDPSGVKWVRLRYRHLTQFEDYESVEMRKAGSSDLYVGEIPGEFVVSRWDLMYLVEAMDERGNGRMYPDLESEMPYVIVHLER